MFGQIFWRSPKNADLLLHYSLKNCVMLSEDIMITLNVRLPATLFPLMITNTHFYVLYVYTFSTCENCVCLLIKGPDDKMCNQYMHYVSDGKLDVSPVVRIDPFLTFISLTRMHFPFSLSGCLGATVPLHFVCVDCLSHLHSYPPSHPWSFQETPGAEAAAAAANAVWRRRRGLSVTPGFLHRRLELPGYITYTSFTSKRRMTSLLPSLYLFRTEGKNNGGVVRYQGNVFKRVENICALGNLS